MDLTNQFFSVLSSNDEEKFNDFFEYVTPEEQKALWLLARRPQKPGGDTALHVASRCGNTHALRLALAAGADAEVTNSTRKRALHEAAQTGHQDCVKALLSHRVSVDALKLADWTPLMLAVAAAGEEHARPANTDYLEVVQLLLKGGATTSAVNKDGWNCMHVGKLSLYIT